MVDRKAYSKKYRETHKEQEKNRHKKYCDEHKEQIREYNQNHEEQRKEYQKKYFQTHKEQQEKYHKKYYQTHKEQQKEYYKEYARKRRAKLMLENPERVRTQNRKNSKVSREKLRNEAIQLLGNKCINPYNLPHPDWCNDPRCLQIDHINGGGRKEIFSFKCRYQYYRFVIEQVKAGSKDYQLLCANCNWLKRHEQNETNHL